MLNEELSCTPPELRNAADVVTHGLVPEKSKARYLKAFVAYKEWCKAKTVKNLGSENVLLAYFGEQRIQKKPSTLWATYSMLRTMLEIEEKCDISKHGKLLAYLKRQNVGFKPKKSNTFSRENIEEFLHKAPNELLVIKVALVVGVSGACRTDELVKMKMADIGTLEEKISIEIPDSKTHTSRSFLITDPRWVKIVRDFIMLRRGIKIDRFLVQVRGGTARNQPIGHNTIANFPKKIATFLKLENIEGFTGHAFRRTSATLLANSGADVLQLKRLGGWKSSTVAEGYVDSSMENKSKTASMLSNYPMSSNASSSSQISTANQHQINLTRDTTIEDTGLKISIHSYNNSNVTINVNNK